MVLGCFSFLLFCVFLQRFCVFQEFLGVFGNEGLFRFLGCSIKFLQIALDCSSTLWRSFGIVAKVSGCFHDCQASLRCLVVKKFWCCMSFQIV